MGFEILITVSTALIVLAAIGASSYALHKSTIAFETSKKDYVELLGQAIDNLKAQSLMERVEAKTMEKESDVRVEMLKDAIKAENDLVKAESAPVFATTSDGESIDMRDYEII
tara:strand:- start:389 stop:727 length:339 start_codon:yes stop_codon:yes gene_type:complete